MRINDKICILKNQMKKHAKVHIAGNDKDKRAAEKEMKKYGCNGPGETFRLIKSLLKG